MQPIEAVGVEIIADPVAAPALAAPRVRTVAFCEGPAHPQVGGLSCQKWSHLVHHYFKVPFAILCGTLCSAHKDVGADAVREGTRDGEKSQADGRERETKRQKE
jgi:hypothetical protein